MSSPRVKGMMKRVSAPAGLAYSAEVLADLPDIYWRLGESGGTIAIDSSVNGRNGTYVGPVTLGAAGAVVGNTAISTLEATSYVDRAFNNYTTQAFTVEFWINAAAFATAITPNQCNPFSNGTFNGHGIATIIWSDGRVEIQTAQLGVTQRTFSAYGAAIPGAWNHICITRSGSVCKTYVNGVDRTATPAVHIDPAVGATTLSLSRGSSGATATYDEFALYPTALSSARIAAHYAARNIAPPADTVIYQHNFIGSSATNLAGVTVDVSSGTFGGSLAPVFAGFGDPSFLKADGSILPNAPSIYSGAFLPFVPQAGNIYRLQAHIYSTVGTAGQLFLMGFMDSVRLMFDDLTSPWGDMISSGSSGVDSSVGNTYVSYNAATAGLTNPAPRDAVFVFELDTRGASWIHNLYWNGILRRTFIYADNPTNITQISIGQAGTGTGRFEDLKLIKKTLP
jgi:hypothetical protein